MWIKIKDRPINLDNVFTFEISYEASFWGIKFFPNNRNYFFISANSKEEAKEMYDEIMSLTKIGQKIDYTII